MKKLFCVALAVLMVLSMFAGCSQKKEKVVIYTSVEDYVVTDMTARLKAQFPEYDIVVEYLSTGNHAAKLKAAGTQSECDITYDLEYAYLEQLEQEGVLADLSEYPTDRYMEDTVVSKNYLVQARVGGAVVLNTQVLQEKGLAEPTCYEDLLKPEFKNLISMANPKSSGTGYMFLKSLVNAWGEEEALQYFDQLAGNVLQFTSSGSGPVNALNLGEVAVGLGMTAQTVIEINKGAPLKIVYFEEGSPFTLYGQSIIKGKETRKCVKEVFDFLVNTYTEEANGKYYPEQMYKDKTTSVENYPQNISYADMTDNTIAEKTRLLDLWKY